MADKVQTDATRTRDVKMSDQNRQEEIRLLSQQVRTLQSRIRELEEERRQHAHTTPHRGNIEHGCHDCSADVRSNVWSCPMCTYDNPVTSKHCEICEEPMPRPSKLPFRPEDIVCDCGLSH